MQTCRPALYVVSMNKEDFRAGILEAIEDMKNPEGDFNKMIAEGRDLAGELNTYDPKLGDKVLAIVASIEDLGAYIRSRGDRG